MKNTTLDELGQSLLCKRKVHLRSSNFKAALVVTIVVALFCNSSCNI